MLSCNVVKDLLPSYIEGLVSAETAQEIEAHLAECADCRSVYEQMTAPIAPIATQENKVIDFLKKVRTKNRQRILICVAITPILLVISLIGIQIYTSGVPIHSEDFDFSIYRITEDYFDFVIDMRLTNGHTFVTDGVDFDFDDLGLVNRFILSPQQTRNTVDVPQSLISTGLAAYYEPVADDFLFIIRLEDQDIVFTLEEILAMPQREPVYATYDENDEITYTITVRSTGSTAVIIWWGSPPQSSIIHYLAPS